MFRYSVIYHCTRNFPMNPHIMFKSTDRITVGKGGISRWNSWFWSIQHMAYRYSNNSVQRDSTILERQYNSMNSACCWKYRIEIGYCEWEHSRRNVCKQTNIVRIDSPAVWASWSSAIHFILSLTQCDRPYPKFGSFHNARHDWKLRWTICPML